MTSRVKRYLYWTTIALGALILALMVLVNTYFSKFNTRDERQPTVNAMPLQTTPEPVMQPAYEGPHPLHWQRPPDPYTYPIPIGQPGPVAPLYSGPLQYPFLCGVRASGLGQPLIDNQDGYGVPVYQLDPITELPTHVVLGYSKDCSIPTQVSYYYNRAGTDDFFPLSERGDDEIAQIEFQGDRIPFVVRMEIGTINRFFYAIAALKGPQESAQADEIAEIPDSTYWNGGLIYQFRGGGWYWQAAR